MTDFNTFGTGIVLLLGAAYFVITIVRDVFNSNNSLRNSERVHRFLLVVGGLLIGLGLGSLQISLIEIEIFGEEFILSLLITLGGLFLVGFGMIYLKNSLWEPLENISEYSAEFGTRFIATRLPELGDIELRKFSERFNKNAISLSNALSELEINVNMVEERIDGTVEFGKHLGNVTDALSDVTVQYSNYSADQTDVINDLNTQIADFSRWYLTVQEELGQNFVELRSLAEMGNLIAINAAVEFANLEEENPGLETLSSRLKEMARSLEERQSALRRILDDIKVNYDEFNNNVNTNLQKALSITGRSSTLSQRVDDIISDIDSRGSNFKENAAALERTIEVFKSNLPRSYG